MRVGNRLKNNLLSCSFSVWLASACRFDLEPNPNPPKNGKLKLEPNRLKGDGNWKPEPEPGN